jgi:TorA maturation chaperone TorD
MSPSCRDRTTKDEKRCFKASSRAKARAKIYDILAYFYNRLPSQEFVDQTKSNLSEMGQCPLPTSKIAKVWHQAFLEKLERLESSIGVLERQEDILELAIERTRLIRGVSSHNGPPPPYESVYRGEGIVMGKNTKQVMNLYREVAYSLPEGWGDLPDYIGIELDFMAYLCRQETEAWQRGAPEVARDKQRQQQEFLANHLMKWAPSFFKQFSSYATNRFLIDVLNATHCFLELEAGELVSNKAPEMASGEGSP